MVSLKYDNFVVFFLFSAVITFATTVSCEAFKDKDDLSENNGNLLELGENNRHYYPIKLEHESFKRAMPRMGKRDGNIAESVESYNGNEHDFSDELVSDDLTSIEEYFKRASPRMGRAMPRMGRAMPRMGRTMPRMGRAMPRMGRAMPRMG